MDQLVKLSINYLFCFKNGSLFHFLFNLLSRLNPCGARLLMFLKKRIMIPLFTTFIKPPTVKTIFLLLYMAFGFLVDPNACNFKGKILN